MKLLDSVRSSLKGVSGMTLKAVAILYIVFVVPMLKEKSLKLLSKMYVKIIALVLIIMVATVDIVSGILLALAYAVTMLKVSKFEAKEEITNKLVDLVDMPQAVVNKLVDKAQDLTQKGVSASTKYLGPAGPVLDKTVDVAEKVIDEVQDVANLAIDSLQELTGFNKDTENFSYLK